MSAKKVFISCILLFFLLFCLTLSISAYNHLHKGLSTVPSDIYLANALSSFAQERCRSAMATWNTSCFTYDCLSYRGNNNVISCGVEDDMNTISFVDTPEGYLGNTHVTKKKYTFLWTNWYLVEFDININARINWYVNSSTHGITLTAYQGYFDLESTVLHELGHALGLDHTDQQYYNGQYVVMYTSCAPQTIIRDISEDDRLGVVNLY